MPSTFVCKIFEIKLYFTNGSINVQFNKIHYSQMAMLMRVPPRSTLEVCLAFHFHLPVHFRSLRLHLRSIPTACPQLSDPLLRLRVVHAFRYLGFDRGVVHVLFSDNPPILFQLWLKRPLDSMSTFSLHLKYTQLRSRF